MSSVRARMIAPPNKRDQRLDMFRGLALAMIFIDHAPGTLYESWTSRNFGFSDAAEAFVLMSGIAAGLAYSTQLATGPLWPAIARVWARARTLYFVHLSTTLMALAIFAAAALWFGIEEPLHTNNIGVVFSQPLGFVIGLPLLTHQLGYFNILPLYLTFLLAAPGVILVGRRYPVATLLASIALWAAAGQWHWNFPNYPTKGGWFFNPFAWQLIFVVGLLSGIAMRQGRALVPFDRVLFWTALAFVIFVGLWARIDWLGAWGRDRLLAPLEHIGFPAYFTWFDKTVLALPRLLHALALAYVLSSIPFVRKIAESPYAAPLTLLGRNGLPVFAAGSVLDMLIQAIKAWLGTDPLSDGVLFAAGLLLLLGLAAVLDRMKQAQRLLKQPSPGAVPITTADLIASAR